MNKSELVAKIATDAGITKKAAEAAVHALVKTVQDAFEAGEKITIHGFGTFESHFRAGRNGRHPQTGEQIFIPGRHVPTFTPSVVSKNKAAARKA